MQQPTLGCKVCSVCDLLNPDDYTYCENGCGQLTALPSTVQSLASFRGIAICPTCAGYYVHRSARETKVCKRDQTPLGMHHFRSQLLPVLSNPSSCPNCQETLYPGTFFCYYCGYLVELHLTYTNEPLIPVSLRRKGEKGYSMVHCSGLVDGGASFNFFPASIAYVLEIDLTNAPTISFGGVIPNVTSIGYKAVVDLLIGSRAYETSVYFSPNFFMSNGGLLGQTGFFDRFTINYDRANKQITIKEGTALLEERYIFCPVCYTETVSLAKGRTNFCWYCGCSLKIHQTILGNLTNGYPGEKQK